VGSLAAVQRASGAKVVIHRSEADLLRSGKSGEVKPTGILGRLMITFFKNPSYEPVNPDIEIDDEWSAAEYGIEGKVVHTPGHTPGSVGVLLSGGEALVGDLFSAKKSGDTASLPIFAANITELRRTMEKLMKYSPKLFYTSHGHTCSPDAVKRMMDDIDK
ncbi:MAG: MBL fold metallo-hydrolase, partial [Chitinivibrionales bacterium]|nr:MBL fold metallo-hydrolase [Chitinivibrionales bacterium]MBD3355601.1 MBL fold metallo-hydrolase [Chitinivibrionales bacterium]